MKKAIITPTNSNAKVVHRSPTASEQASLIQPNLEQKQYEFDKRMAALRTAMVENMRSQNKYDNRVLQALAQVPRHLFVDDILAGSAYQDLALPIGYRQTISMPSVVGRMISILLQGSKQQSVLEVGTGCGYQAAVLSKVFDKVDSIERIRGLYDLSLKRLAKVNISNVQVHYCDGMLGLPKQAPFDAIIIAAAGLLIPNELIGQLAIGGRLIAPEGDNDAQKLVLIERESANYWIRKELEPVSFVPLRSGLQ